MKGIPNIYNIVLIVEKKLWNIYQNYQYLLYSYINFAIIDNNGLY